jgi:hypothetical protein
MGHGIKSTKSIEQERKCKVTYNRMSQRSAHSFCITCCRYLSRISWGSQTLTEGLLAEAMLTPNMYSGAGCDFTPTSIMQHSQTLQYLGHRHPGSFQSLTVLYYLDLYKNTFNSSDYNTSDDIFPCRDPLLGNDRETKKQLPLLGNRFLVNNNWTTTEERCFLCDPCRDVITRAVSWELGIRCVK